MGKEIRILFVLETLKRGGTERQVSLIIDHIRKFGYKPFVIVLYENGYWGDYLREKGIPLREMGFKAPPTVNRRIIVPFLKFIVCVIKIKPDIILSSLYRASLWTAFVTAIVPGPCLISNRRDCGFVRKIHPFPLPVERIGMRMIDYYVAVSKKVMEYTISEGVLQERIHVIYNGVELPSLEGNPYGKCDALNRKIVIGMLANLSVIKDHITLVHAMEYIVKIHPEVCCLLGGSDAGMLQKISDEIKRLSLDRYVQYRGPVSDSGSFIRSIDIGVLCSISEGFSNTILEYMSYGKPVVATDVDGNREIVIHEVTGLLVPVRDPIQLSRGLCELIHDPEKMVLYGRNGRERVEKRFSIDTIIREWDLLFRGVMGNKIDG